MRNSPQAILLRESYREGGKVRKRTLCNLSDWPIAHIEGLRGVLKGGTVISPPSVRPSPSSAACHTATLPPTLGTARNIGLDRILRPPVTIVAATLVLALLVSRILDPVSKPPRRRPCAVARHRRIEPRRTARPRRGR